MLSLALLLSRARSRRREAFERKNRKARGYLLKGARRPKAFVGRRKGLAMAEEEAEKEEWVCCILFQPAPPCGVSNPACARLFYL